jgi:uncharacterized protein (TIRG00374 family)
MKKWIKFGVSLLITAVCFWWTFRDTNWQELWVSLRTANWLILIPFLLILCVIHVARTLRWGNLLSGLEVVPFKKLNEASAIGFMMLVVLPFRLGEFARPFLIAQRSSIRRSAAMTSVVLERIVDAEAIALMLFVLTMFVPGDTDELHLIRKGATGMFVVFGLLLLALLIARWKPDFVFSAMRGTMGRVVKGPTEKLITVVEGFVGALKQLPDGKNMAMFFGWTLLYWVLNGWGMSIFANAFDCAGGTAPNCSPLHISVFQGFIVLGALVVGMLIPAAPASAGTFHYSIKLALRLFVPAAVVEGSGLAFINALWLLQIAQQVLFGVIFMVASHSSFSDIAGKLGTDEAPASR